ncbi:MAG: exodeoxyribonuclease III, partial [Acidimicrobiia bacterium]
NGVAILSRVGLTDVSLQHEGHPEPRLASAQCGPLHVTSVYVPNGRAVGSEHYAYKLSWLERLRRHLETTARPDQPVAVCGDFNVAPEDRDVWDPAAFASSTHVTGPERAALAHLRDWGLVDAFRLVRPEDRLFTYWDYRAGDFHNHRGMRIDLVLVSRPLADRVNFALVDRNARKGKLPSDHAPLLVDVAD